MQNQFDELLHQKLYDFCDDPDEGLIDKIQMKKERVIRLYRLLPLIISVVAITLAGIWFFTSGEEHKNLGPDTQTKSLSGGETLNLGTGIYNNTNNTIGDQSANNIIPAKPAAALHPVNVYSSQTFTANSNSTMHFLPPVLSETPAELEHTTGTENNLCEASFDYYTSYTGELFFINTSNAEENLSLAWNFGDGAESRDQNPSHQFGKDGKYQVQLTYSNNGKYVCSAEKEITYATKNILRNNSIKGSVFQDFYISKGASVALYRENELKGKYELYAMTKTDASGSYQFEQLENGKYMLMAEKSDNPGFASTWYGNVVKTENAERIVIDDRDLQNGKLFDINLQRINTSNPIDMALQRVDTGGAYVILMDRFNNVVGSFKTDRSGNLLTGQTQLPPGAYKVINPTNSKESTVQVGAAGAGTIDHFDDLTTDKTGDETGVQPREDLRIMPNPAVSDIHFEVKLEDYQQIFVRIINSNGVEVYNENSIGMPGANKFNIMIGSFPPGMYYVIVKKEQGIPVVSQLIKAN